MDSPSQVHSGVRWVRRDQVQERESGWCETPSLRSTCEQKFRDQAALPVAHFIEECYCYGARTRHSWSDCIPGVSAEQFVCADRQTRCRQLGGHPQFPSTVGIKIDIYDTAVVKWYLDLVAHQFAHAATTELAREITQFEYDVLPGPGVRSCGSELTAHPCAQKQLQWPWSDSFLIVSRCRIGVDTPPTSRAVAGSVQCQIRSPAPSCSPHSC